MIRPPASLAIRALWSIFWGTVLKKVMGWGILLIYMAKNFVRYLAREYGGAAGKAKRHRDGPGCSHILAVRHSGRARVSENPISRALFRPR